MSRPVRAHGPRQASSQLKTTLDGHTDRQMPRAPTYRRVLRTVPFAIPIAVLLALLVLLADGPDRLRLLGFWVTQSVFWIWLLICGGMILALFVTTGSRRIIALLLGVAAIVSLAAAWDRLLPW